MPAPRRIGPLVALFAALAGLAGCGADPIGVPPEHAELVGTWRHGNVHHLEPGETFMLLTIRGDGAVSYARYDRGTDGHRCSVIGAGALTAIDEGGLDVKVFGPFGTRFTLDAPPHRESGTWTMTVDGVRLERASRRVGFTAAGLDCEDGRLTAGPEHGREPAPEEESSDGGGVTI